MNIPCTWVKKSKVTTTVCVLFINTLAEPGLVEYHQKWSAKHCIRVSKVLSVKGW